MSDMKSVMTTSAVTLPAGGRVELTASQAASRKHSLRRVRADKAGAGTYEILAPVQFKAGERFGYDADLPKAMADVLIDPARAAAQARERELLEQRAREQLGAQARAALCERLIAEVSKLDPTGDVRGAVLDLIAAAAK